MSWRFIGRGALELLHDESLAEHGGRAGVTPGLLEAVAFRAQRVASEGQSDAATLAALYGAALVRSPAFVDGNPRAAFLATGLFLALNGHRLVASQAEATLTLLALAAGDLAETEFADWLRQHIRPRQT